MRRITTITVGKAATNPQSRPRRKEDDIGKVFRVYRRVDRTMYMITSTIVRKPRQRPTTVPLQNDDEVSHGNIVCVPLYRSIVGGCGEESQHI